MRILEMYIDLIKINNWFSKRFIWWAILSYGLYYSHIYYLFLLYLHRREKSENQAFNGKGQVVYVLSSANDI